jgi:TRAP-type C4-dicarboxylate transport system permease small subunit
VGTDEPTVNSGAAEPAPEHALNPDSRTELRSFRRNVGTAVAYLFLAYRSVGLVMLLAGWLGELAIIVTRNFISSEPAWTVEAATLAIMYGTLLYIGVATDHIGFDLISRPMARRSVHLARIRPLLGLAVTVFLLIESVRAVEQSKQFGGLVGTAGLNIQLWLVYLAAPIFLSALIIRFLGDIVSPPRGNAAATEGVL